MAHAYSILVRFEHTNNQLYLSPALYPTTLQVPWDWLLHTWNTNHGTFPKEVPPDPSQYLSLNGLNIRTGLLMTFCHPVFVVHNISYFVFGPATVYVVATLVDMLMVLNDSRNNVASISPSTPCLSTSTRSQVLNSLIPKQISSPVTLTVLVAKTLALTTLSARTIKANGNIIEIRSTVTCSHSAYTLYISENNRDWN